MVYEPRNLLRFISSLRNEQRTSKVHGATGHPRRSRGPRRVGRGWSCPFRRGAIRLMNKILHDPKDPKYGNYGIFLIMGHAGFCPSTVCSVLQLLGETPIRFRQFRRSGRQSQRHQDIRWGDGKEDLVLR